ncbi:MAG: Ldh family oxidoreductase [Fibrobacteres bacterium]|nr:Ldh family oxidoreductase [Fibrobacterota bacterium]
MKRVPIKDLVRFGCRLLEKKGMPHSSAQLLAEFIVETEAFRATTHGLGQLAYLVGSLGESLDPKKKVKVIRDKGAMVLLEGEKVPGILCMKELEVKLLKKVKSQGVAFGAVRGTTWVGSLGSHLVPYSKAGYLAMAWAQTSACKDCAPLGGIDARFSTNPIAVAFPTAKVPMLADFSTASYSMAAVRGMINRGEKSSIPRFIDSTGTPTCDPSVLDKGGSIMFTGLDLEGHKFYGLSLFIEAMTAMAGGSANHPDRPSRQSAMVMVLNPSFFGGATYYMKEIKRFVDHVKKARVRKGFDAIRLPGERGFAALNEAKKRGVPLDNSKLAMLEKMAKEYNIEWEVA